MRTRTEQTKKTNRYVTVFIVMTAMLGLLVVLNIHIGSVSIPFSEVVDILFFHGGEEVTSQIVWQIRMPRMVMVILLGGGLSLSGFLLQTYFNNPIAGPYILGISSGAKMVVALTMIWFLKRYGMASSTVLILAAFAGSLLAVGFVLYLSRRIQNMSVLLIGGIMISYICSAVTDFVVTFAEEADIVNLHGWSLGSFSGMDWKNCQVAGVMIGILFVVSFLLSKPIGAYQLGEAYAKSMGVNVKVFRVVLILLSSLLSACVTAFAGPISFVGIAVPHLVKRSFNTAKPLVVIPAIFLGGSVFCLFCDLLARTMFAPTELNISTVTAFFGAPVVILLLIKRRGGRE